MSEKKIKILATIPQVVFESVEIEISEEAFKNSGDGELGEIVWNTLTEDQKDWCPGRFKGYLNAIEFGYATIEKAEKQ